MGNRLPDISSKHRICIICEGNEEFKYIERLNELLVWNGIYEVSPVNAEGNGNIPARYQDRYQNGSYEMVFVLCDTEKKPYEQYEDIKRKINEFHGDEHAADKVLIFANPCTLQIVSKHWTEEMIKSPAKAVNASLIEKYTGVKGYKGRADQIDEMMRSVTADNFKDMRQRVRSMETDDTVVGNSNFGMLIEVLTNDDSSWIERINQKLENN